MNANQCKQAFWACVLSTFLLSPAVAAPDQCLAPDEAAGTIADIPNASSQLASGKALDILSIGSVSALGAEGGVASETVGSRVSGPNRFAVSTGGPYLTVEQMFPSQMRKALQDAVAGTEVRLTMRGGKGLTSAQMLDILRSELSMRPYQLVIWQTGTVEAVRNLPPSDFAATLSAGAALAQEAQADLVLVDPQFSRFLQTNTNFDPYAQVFQQVAAMPGVMLFHRYDLMRIWVNDGQIDLERTPRNEHKQAIELLHHCLGVHLARLILSAARS